MSKFDSDKNTPLHLDLKDLEVIDNPWDNSYWFARFLINSDKYGGVGGESEIMLQISEGLTVITKKMEGNPEETVVQAAIEFIKSTLWERWKNTKKIGLVMNLCRDIEDKFTSVVDVKVFILTCEKILHPINQALEAIPNNDKIFAESMATALLKTKNEKGLSEIINLWDDLGVQGCLSAERVQVIKKFGLLKQSLEKLLNTQEQDIVLTAFCQEFERRLGQKRKGRAGRGVESVTSFILNYYNIKAVHAPEHFTTGLEIDKWIKTSDGWFIGISCKRTLR
ncbi:MAG: hypothetical protein ACREBV_04910 [Candidatus Zixiibacteriota bacterium]